MRHTRSFPLALLMAGSSLMAAPARAEGPKVLLLPYQPVSRQASPELCTQVTTVLTNELGGSDAVTMVAGSTDAASEGDGEAKPTAETEKAEAAAKTALDKALTLSQAGDKQVKKLKFDPAIKTLTESLKQFDAAAAAVTDVGPVTQAHLNLAVAYWKRGMEDESMAEMAAAARLDPELKPDPKEFWPLFLRVYDQQWRKALRAPRVKIRVDATVPGAEVFFNGKSVGATPLLLTNVVPGFHYIRVVKEGAGAFGARVEAKDDANEVTANLGGSGPAGGGLGPVANAVTANRVDDDAFAAAAAVGKAQGAEYVLFGGVTKGERGITVATFMVAVKDGKAGRLVDLEFDLDLLSASVESFKLVEEVGARVKTFGDTLPKGSSQTVVRGLAEAEGGGGTTEVDVGPAMPDVKGAKDPAQDGRNRVNDDGGEGGEGSRAIGGDDDPSGKKKKPRATLGDGRTAASRGDDYKPTTPIYLNPLFIVPIVAVAVGAGVLALALLAGGGTAGGVAAYVLLAPPQAATVEAEWPK